MAGNIRPMALADLPQVQEIDGTAFTELLSRLRHQPIELPPHEREYFEHWMRCDPDGMLVYEDGEEILGFNCCHAGPRMGWIGPIAVRLGKQTRGVGKALMLAGLEYFDRVGTKTVGLDTFPENPVSVSLYLKTGFRVVGGLFLLTMEIPEKRETLAVTHITVDDAERVASIDQKASGFDRVRDYEFVIDSGHGSGIKLAEAGNNFVFALIRRGMSLISNFHLPAGDDLEERVTALVEGAFDFFRSRGLTAASALCRGADTRLLDALFGLGFRMSPAMITMHRGTDAPPTPLTSPFAIEKG